MNNQIKKRIFDLLWAALAAATTAFLATLVPGIKEIIGDTLTTNLAPFAAAIAVMVRG